MARSQTQVWLILTVLLCLVCYLPGQSKKPQVPLFRADVVTVFVKVAVSDPLDRYVTGLEKEDFKIYEDNVEQDISHFSQESAPISVGLLFDISNSMGFGRHIQIAKKYFMPMLESSKPEDEYFLVTFNDKVNLIQAFTQNTAEVQNQITYQKAGGWTALYDAVYMGLDQVRRGKNEKKALILITDGEDNSSRYRFREVREFCQESSVQIYAIGLPGPVGYGGGLLKELVNLTGGRVFFPDRGTGLEYYFDLIHTELRNQYLLGYVPKNTTRDGKWRQITIKLDAPRGLPKLSIRAKKGYYAPSN